MVVGLFVDLSVVNDQAHGSGAKFSHQKTRATMAGVVPVFIFLDEASIYLYIPGSRLRSRRFGPVGQGMNTVSPQTLQTRV